MSKPYEIEMKRDIDVIITFILQLLPYGNRWKQNLTRDYNALTATVINPNEYGDI